MTTGWPAGAEIVLISRETAPVVLLNLSNDVLIMIRRERKKPELSL
ncbi:MAG: hypothetical protein J7J75_02790 [Euryarchaeota archaeon]|nr:hypothetical protein [Euryarchaeota archaeon]MCD6158553.1 hypothetical protein [Euryarchaeota archaeon]